ncbi:hypothetical protein [Iningainema tapete]|uniref:Uncharacterized protein n=1 Tax=Iningainema tapete BLCC-T55 TaxID=2748662 RepID=A0A8J7BX82_9CYAN|nr:hypothetical protein [Iningainema tapete]MBD2772443.1 hypothetical protein [Iningainema tapete BLCC-T55]
MLLVQTVAFLPIDRLDGWQCFEQPLATEVVGSSSRYLNREFIIRLRHLKIKT